MLPSFYEKNKYDIIMFIMKWEKFEIYWQFKTWTVAYKIFLIQRGKEEFFLTSDFCTFLFLTALDAFLIFFFYVWDKYHSTIHVFIIKDINQRITLWIKKVTQLYLLQTFFGDVDYGVQMQWFN